MLKEIKKDFRQRFRTFETVAGAYFMFVGLVMFYDLRSWSILLPLTILLYGVRLLVVNRIKQKKQEMREIKND